MKTLVRCCYLGLIVLIVLIQVTHGQHDQGASDPLAALATRLERLNVRTEQAAGAEMLIGHAPFCAPPILARLLPIDGSEDERLRGLHAAAVTVKYVYLGAAGEQRDKAAMIGRWMWAKMLFAVGWHADKPSLYLVLLVLPRACAGLAARDWTTLSPWQ